MRYFLQRPLKGMTLEELEKSMMKSDDEMLVASPPARYSGNRPTAHAEEEHRLLMRALDNKAGLTRQQLANTQVYLFCFQLYHLRFSDSQIRSRFKRNIKVFNFMLKIYS